MSTDRNLETTVLNVQLLSREQIPALKQFWQAMYREGRITLNPDASSQQSEDRIIFESPFSPGQSAVWAAQLNTEIVGHLRVLPWRAWHNDGEFAFSYWQRFYVAPNRLGKPRADAGLSLAIKAIRSSHAHIILGDPGRNSPASRLYQAMGWRQLGPIPFYWGIVDGRAVLQNLHALRVPNGIRNWVRRHPVWSGPASTTALHLGASLLRPSPSTIFSGWDPDEEAEALWHRVKNSYRWVAERSPKVLRWRFQSPGYSSHGCYHGRKLQGWVVTKLTKMNSDRYFGDLRVGTIVDLLCDANDMRTARDLLQGAIRNLADSGAQLIVMNTSHQGLCLAARKQGLLPGPSNFYVLSHGVDLPALSECHFMRADSDGDASL